MTAPDLTDAEREQDDLVALQLCLYDDDSLSRIPQPEPLIENWLAMDTLVWIFGERGHCKSFVAMDMAACVGNGIDWHGHAVKQVPVLYVVLEGASGLHQRARTWSAYYGRPGTAITFLVPRPPLQIVRHGPALGSLAADMDAGLIIVDTQNRATVGLDEGSNVDMGRMIAALDLIREQTRACIAVVHHSAVGSHRPRGHSSIDGAASSMIRVARDGRLVKVANDKQRESEQTASVMLALSKHDLGVVLTAAADETPTDSENRVMACLRDLAASKDKVTWTDLKRSCESTGMPPSTFNWALRKLIEFGRITRNGSGYAVTNTAQGRLGD